MVAEVQAVPLPPEFEVERRDLKQESMLPSVFENTQTIHTKGNVTLRPGPNVVKKRHRIVAGAGRRIDDG